MTTCACTSCRPQDPGPTYTEAHRHACEVRYVAAMARYNQTNYLLGKRGVAERRGRGAAKHIIQDLHQLRRQEGSATVRGPVAIEPATPDLFAPSA